MGFGPLSNPTLSIHSGSILSSASFWALFRGWWWWINHPRLPWMPLVLALKALSPMVVDGLLPSSSWNSSLKIQKRKSRKGESLALVHEKLEVRGWHWNPNLHTSSCRLPRTGGFLAPTQVVRIALQPSPSSRLCPPHLALRVVFLSSASESPGGPGQAVSEAPPSEFLIQQVWAELDNLHF